MTFNKFFVCIIALSFFVLTSCEEKGPRGSFRMPDRSTDDIVEDVLDAQETGWLYEYDAELYYLSDGEWTSAGMFSVYCNMSENAEPNNKWVDFGDSFFIPARRTDYAGYDWCVTYHGTKFYW